MADPAPRTPEPENDWIAIGGELLEQLRLELAEERSRKASLESRALTASAAAAAAVTILLGLGSQYSGRWQTLFFVLLLVGSLAFLATALFGWLTAKVVGYEEISLDEYEGVLDDG